MPTITHRRRLTTDRPWILRACIAALVCLLVSFRSPVGSVKEYEAKAAFLYTFAKFMTYPETAFASPEAPFVIGVLGEDPFGDALDAALKDKKIGKRPVVVERYAKLALVKAPHILFVSRSEVLQQAEIVRVLKSRPIFLVGDMEGFAAQGATANFFVDKTNLRFAISTGAAKTARVQISAQLLNHAQVLP